MNIKINLDTIKTLLKPLKLYKQTGYASIDRPWDRKKTEIDVPDCNTYDYLLQRSKFNASNILSRCHEDVLTMDRLKEEVEVYAKSFLAMGVKKGDVVPLCLQTNNESIIAFFALNKIGAISTFLNATANKDEIELTTIYRNRLSLVEVESVKLDTIRLYDSIGGVWKLETYLVDNTCTTNFKYRLLIDDEDDYSTIRVLNTDNYCVKLQEK